MCGPAESVYCGNECGIIPNISLVSIEIISSNF